MTLTYKVELFGAKETAQAARTLFEGGKRGPIFRSVVAMRDVFRARHVKERLRAPDRSDKTRLMRDTGTMLRSYRPRESFRQKNIWAEWASDYFPARVHEKEGPALKIIRPIKAKALFVPLGDRPGARGIRPGDSSLEAGKDFVFRKRVVLHRRQTLKWTHKDHASRILRKGEDVFERTVKQRWKKGI